MQQDNVTNPWKKWIILGSVVTALLIGLLTFRVLWVTFVDNYEMAYNYNSLTGKIEILDKTGYIIRTPFINSVHTIDLRPYQVTISANERVLNAKLVRFNPAGLEKFLEWHGRGAGEDKDKLLEILKCYAFAMNGGEDCPFLTVINVVQPGSQNGDATAQPGPKK